ncbi:cupin domain-containing protein [Burkholderia sp. Tr-20390]|uniref:cupin domain-containing protein n=1 Tax=Burkholderia sp. Tr-20390 TaxID=2703904 RepID=UPI001981C270|nr:cupin domain-containing protein [Burkholderia sp. Tr-20390]MBN3729641.1 cupin domain-containing protein [Burkholderia sp. Tr-20390]
MDSTKRSAFFIEPTCYPRPLKVVGEHVTVLASAKRTGAYEVLLQDGVEGSGPPPHHHPWDESFYVTGGEITFKFNVGDQEQQVVARAGTFVHLPAGTVHSFRFGEGGGQMINIGSRDALEPMFAHLDREISPSSPDFERFVNICAEHQSLIQVPD